MDALEDDAAQRGVPSSRSTYNIHIPKGGTKPPPNALVPIPEEPGCYLFRGCKITTIGVEFPADTDLTTWMELGGILLDMESAITFALGDWLNFGEDRQWGETYRTIAQERGVKIETIWTYAWVMRKLRFKNRSLSFAHHRKVCSLRDPETGAELQGDALAAWQEYWLNTAAEQQWSVSQLDAAINGPKPPTPSPADDPVGYAHYSLSKIQKRLPRIGKLDSGARMQIADLLETLARQYREG